MYRDHGPLAFFWDLWKDFLLFCDAVIVIKRPKKRLFTYNGILLSLEKERDFDTTRYNTD
jgi:hypothetical protein